MSARSSAPRAGRPRDRQIDASVLNAALAVLDESGYAGLRIEEVARRAGTTKPAIYRRWPGRPHLVLAALAARLGTVRAPDTGCTLCDLNEGINVFIAAFHRIRPDVLGPLLADCSADPGLRSTFMATLFDPPRAAVAEMLDRAVARGDLRADIDRSLVLDMLGSLVHYRALFGHAPNGPAEVERAVEALLRGIATDYPALLEHSRRLAAHAAAHPHG
ncbi:TetR/AcrR family transcriptional regulator [Thermomonospora cellulosilytica]|uniref:AcrR family transcriptional regulator n=1 Tax=Thermomonospora cellulosilytica TaxID=1411118 RepID=A0A7W3N4V9_9ACTN|nr:TetR/AcrR family transcriptional regulator [Thermomonospora cellulosilytica]MBA9007572.1 AcrR family transcriptional regulator [Thermomonospora cellulosilytica]